MFRFNYREGCKGSLSHLPQERNYIPAQLTKETGSLERKLTVHYSWIPPNRSLDLSRCVKCKYVRPSVAFIAKQLSGTDNKVYCIHEYK
jgi:hypothetical protein